MSYVIDVEALLRRLAIKAERHGSKWAALCPNPKHDDKRPSWAIVDKPGSKRHGSHFCQSCKWGGGPWELAAAIWNVSVEEAGERLTALVPQAKRTKVDVPKIKIVDSRRRREFKLPLGVEIPGADGKWYTPARCYLDRRGTTPYQIDRWGIGYAIRGKLSNRVVVPVRDGRGRLLTYAARSIAKGIEPRYDSGNIVDGARPRFALWGEERWDGTAIATVCEGIFGGLALERAGAPNPTALLGSELTPEKATKLARFEALLIVPDHDPSGEKVKGRLEMLGRRARVRVLDLDEDPDDAGESDPEGLAKKIARGLSILC